MNFREIDLSDFYEMQDAIMQGIDDGRSELSLYNEASSAFHAYLWNIDKEMNIPYMAKAYVALCRFIAVRGDIQKELSIFCLDSLMKDITDKCDDLVALKAEIKRLGSLVKKSESEVKYAV